MEPAHLRITVENAVGGSISLLGSREDLTSAIRRLGQRGWSAVDTEVPPTAGRFSASPVPLVAEHRSVA